ncbi:MAG TPA: serine/threonine-protein kinase [Blastocatellia bacterium]|nr:serine/threonine-protein kinase [Blastocatellia bacterium]
MNQERWKRIETLFESAIERDTSERAAFLDEACGGDVTLRREVESLLEHHQPTGKFITTMVHEAARLLPQDKSFTSGGARFIPGTVLANRYRIIALLGKGGMGEVYRADDLKLSQPVALKFLPEKLVRDKGMLERFHREVRIARQISHPNVCRVFDIGEVEDQHFLSMEYIDGENLSTLLRRIGRLPSDKAVEIASQLCDGLRAAHQEGVLHRDLKPANVMIDGRGRAKITDFGLAGLADEFEGNEIQAGTPAYMAPEQLAGKEVTTKSDIYALGLVLYEVFTGKKAFEAATLEELVRLHESSTPPSISSHVKEVDPLVERVILRCLERDPSKRPTSVVQVAAALPGGDPLAAAIAAGETPSPEMVAAAPKEGGLRPAVAIACLAAFFIELALAMFLSNRLMYHNNLPLEKSPEVLAYQSSNLIKSFGYADSPADVASGIWEDTAYYAYARQRESSFEDWKRLETGQPMVYFFWYRQSPRPMPPSSTKVTLSDPPMDTSGMAKVILDVRGRLVEFYAIPPQVDASASTAQFDWSAAFTQAGLNIANFRQIESVWIPPTYADTRLAWEGAYADHAEIPIRVEAAAYRGRLVYFHIIPPWEKPTRQEEVSGGTSRQAAGFILAAVFFAGIAASVLLARRNLRLGRGDRKGAFKLAVFLLLMILAGQMIGADHVPALGAELDILFNIIAWALSASVLFWILYVALEPYVRRLWPRLIISWSRLLAGDFRDPMVGRDILIGSLLGFGHTLSICLMPLASRWAGKPSGLINSIDPRTLEGGRSVITSLLSSSLVQWFLIGVGLLFILLLFYILLRRQWLAALAMWLLFATVEVLAFAIPGPFIFWVGPLLNATLAVVAAARFGLLTTLSFQFFFDLSFHYAITPNLSSWHAQTTFIVLPILITVALYSFYTSLAGQSVFQGEVIRD